MSVVTGLLEPHYPAWKRHVFIFFISYPVILASLIVVFATMWGILELQNMVNISVRRGDVPYLCKFLPNILLALCISIYDGLYKRIARWLNNKGTWLTNTPFTLQTGFEPV